MKQDDMARLLPAVFQLTLTQPNNPLPDLLAVMEGLHAPTEAVLANLASYFDPYQTPDRFVPFLASWVDLDWLLASGERLGEQFPAGLGRLRELIAAAAFLAKWRGTTLGLIRFLETVTGISGFAIDEEVLDQDNQPRPFHIRVRVPLTAAGHEALIRRIIESEKPAYVSYQLQVGERVINERFLIHN